MSVYSQFVKQNWHNVPDGPAPMKMRAIARLWQQHKSGRSAPKTRKRRGRGVSDAEVKQAAAPPAETAPDVPGEGMAGAGRKRKPRARRGRGGSEAPIQWSGGEAAPIAWSGGALNPLASGAVGSHISQTGLGIFSGMLSQIGLGFRNTGGHDEGMAGEGIFDDVMNGVRSVGSLAPAILPFVL